jgi:hypothetical protein
VRRDIRRRRKPFVPVRGEPALLSDLSQVVLPGECRDRGGFAQACEGIDGDRALDLVAVLGVGVLLASRLARRELLPEDFTGRVSVNLHKCSTGAGIFEKVQS